MPDRPNSEPAEQLAEVVQRVRQGSPESLAALYRLFADQILGTAYRILGNRADAEDVLQDVFVGLPEALSLYREEGRLAAWLRRVAARTALMRLRRQRREASFSDGVDLPLRQAADARVVDRLAVADALDRMPEMLRQVFLLKEVEGFTHSEIASLLGISAGASGVRLHRAWLLIHKLLGTREHT